MKALKRSHTSSSNSASPSSSSPSSSSWIHLRSVLFIVANSSPASCSSSFDRSRLKSPWSRRKRKHVLTPQHWRSVFLPDGKLRDGGVKVLKKVRSGGIHPSIRSELWPYLLGVYDLRSSKEERDVIRTQNRKKYEKLRRQSRRLLSLYDRSYSIKHYSGRLIQDICSPSSEEVESARESLSSGGERSPPPPDNSGCLDCSSSSSSVVYLEGNVSSRRIRSSVNTDSSETDSSDDDAAQVFQASSSPPCVNKEEEEKKNNCEMHTTSEEIPSLVRNTEDFATWQRIIRVDAVRANLEWMPYSFTQAAVSDSRARRSAEAVGLKDYDHLDPYRIFHAARLVAILEAYAVYDPEIGYCQGMSDLLSPIVAIISEDHEAFWCFVGFMKKARHNFRVDEMGIRRQLRVVSKIIKFKDSHLYRHLQKLQAEDCFFVYRMVVVVFRRELTVEQTMCLWEVMWADQAAIRAGIGKSGWSRIRQRGAPPTDDLLLYAIAASVLQRRKLIIERYRSMDEILRECNSMAGQLDVWKLLDDAHDLVVTLHEKVK